MQTKISFNTIKNCKKDEIVYVTTSTQIVKFCIGGSFCNLDQLYKKFSGNEVFLSPKLNEDQKQGKGLRLKLKSFFPEIRRRPIKKRSSPQFATIFGRKFVGSFSPGWLFFLWSSSAQLSMGGRLNFDGGTLTLDGGFYF